MPKLFTREELNALSDEEVNAAFSQLAEEIGNLFARYPAHVQIKIARAQADAMEDQTGADAIHAFCQAWSSVTAEWVAQGRPQEEPH